MTRLGHAINPYLILLVDMCDPIRARVRGIVRVSVRVRLRVRLQVKVS